MIIDFYSKTFALTNTIEVPTSFVPRVGETFTISHPVGHLEPGRELLIHDVTYIIKEDSIVPHVKCHDSSGDINRRHILEENGWI